MPLADFQAALGSMIAQGAKVKVASPFHLTPEEAQWLKDLPDAAGFKVTCAIQQWWRETRLRDLARLTIAVLGSDHALQMISTYFRENLCTSLFFLPETLGFLRFVQTNAAQSHLAAIAQFEAGLLVAKEEAASATPANASTVTIVKFQVPPLELLSAVLQGQTLPTPSAEAFPVIISAQLPHYWRPLSQQEYLELVSPPLPLSAN